MSLLKGIKLNGSDEVHKLDYEEALGNKPPIIKSFNDLEDKPFEATTSEVDILPQADYEFMLAESGLYCYAHSETLSLTSDTTYVEWDGTIYECTPSDVGNETYAFGNLYIMNGLEDSNTGEPFLIINEGFGVIATFNTSTSHNVRIYQTKEVVQYLDHKYIKDMYHDQKEIKVTLIEEQSYEITTTNPSTDSYITADISLGLEEAKTYYVIFDGQEYECEATIISQVSDGETINALVFGNQALNDSTQTDTGEPFYYGKLIGYNLENLTVSTSGTHTLAVKTKELGIEYIKPKYIKDMYYQEDTVTLKYGGDYQNYEKVSISDDGTNYQYIVKVSDDVIEVNDFLNAKVGAMQGSEDTVIEDVVDMSKDLTEDGLSVENDYFSYADFLFVVSADSVEFEGFVLTKGIWFMDILYSGQIMRITSLSYNKTHHIPTKYIKDMYSSEIVKKTLFHEQDVNFTEMSESELTGNGYVHTPSIDIDGSNDVIVVWDGITYKCTPTVDSDTETSREIYVGNLSAVGGEDTGEPFLIVDNLELTVFTSADLATHKVAVHQVVETVQQIDPKYVNAYTKEQMDEMFGAYVTEVDTLLGGE